MESTSNFSATLTRKTRPDVRADTTLPVLRDFQFHPQPALHKAYLTRLAYLQAGEGGFPIKNDQRLLGNLYAVLVGEGYFSTGFGTCFETVLLIDWLICSRERIAILIKA